MYICIVYRGKMIHYTTVFSRVLVYRVTQDFIINSSIGPYFFTGPRFRESCYSKDHSIFGVHVGAPCLRKLPCRGGLWHPPETGSLPALAASLCGDSDAWPFCFGFWLDWYDVGASLTINMAVLCMPQMYIHIYIYIWYLPKDLPNSMLLETLLATFAPIVHEADLWRGNLPCIIRIIWNHF